MYDTQIRQRFIELRAQGLSLGRIAAQLNIAKRTLVDWNREAQQDIRDLKEVELEALHERVLVSHEEELSRLSAHLNRIEAVLAKRNIECLSTESLFVMAATVRAQLRRLTASPLLARQDQLPREGERPRETQNDLPIPAATDPAAEAVANGGAA